MWKRLCIALVLMGSSLMVSAQTFEPGLAFGVVTSQLNGDGYGGFNKLGLTFGGTVKYQINDHWSTQFELLYVQKGSRSDFSVTSNDPSSAVNSRDYFLMRLNYIEIPLLARFHHNKFIFEGGLSYGQLVGLYMEGWTGNNAVMGPIEDLDEFNERFTNPLRNWEFAGHLGLGFKATESLVANIRYSFSLYPIKDYDSGGRDTSVFNLNLGWGNSVIAFTMRYKFGDPDIE